MKIKSLSDLKVGESAIVVEVNHQEPSFLERLCNLGFVKGTSIKVTQRGLFGSPINIKLLGSVLSLRSNEASAIQVTTTS